MSKDIQIVIRMSRTEMDLVDQYRQERVLDVALQYDKAFTRPHALRNLIMEGLRSKGLLPDHDQAMAIKNMLKGYPESTPEDIVEDTGIHITGVEWVIDKLNLKRNVKQEEKGDPP